MTAKRRKHRKKIGEDRTDDARDSRGRFAVGGRGGPGRRPGSPNRVTRTVKDAVIAALNSGAGAAAFFVKLKNSRTAEDRRTFATVCARLIPRQIEMEGALDVSEQPNVVVYMPYDNRGPMPNESVEAFRERCRRHDEQVRREAEELRRRRERGED